MILPLLLLGVLAAAPTVGPDSIPLVDLDTVALAKAGSPGRTRWLFQPSSKVSPTSIAGRAGVETVAVLERLGGLWILEAPTDSLLSVEALWSNLGELRQDRDGVPALSTSTQLIGARPIAWDGLDLRGDMTSAVAILDSGCDTAHDDLGDPDGDNEDNPPQSAGDADDWVDAGLSGFSPDTELRVMGWHDVTDDMPGSRGPYDYHLHGTALASAAFGDGGVADAGRGVAPEGRFVVVKTYNFEGHWRVWASDFLLGVEWVLNNRDAYRIRAVLAGAVWDEDLGFTTAVGALRDAGIALIAPSGNTPQAGPAYPAAVPDAISVGATDDSGRLAAYSQPGPTVGPSLDLLAPGGSQDDLAGRIEVADNEPHDAYRGRYGTSLAAAHVAGAVSLVTQVLTESGRPWRHDAGQVRWLGELLAASAVEVQAAESAAPAVPPATRWSVDPIEGAGLLCLPAALDAVRNVIWPGESRQFLLDRPNLGRSAWAARIPTQGRQTLRLELFPPQGADFDLFLHREEDDGLPRVAFSARVGAQAEMVEVVVPEPGWWVVVVKRVSGAGQAQLVVSQPLVAGDRWPVAVSSTLTVSPTVSDLNGDGSLEIIVPNNVAIDPAAHTIHVLRTDGSLLAPFPRTFFSAPTRPGILRTPSVADLGAGPIMVFGSSFGDVWGVDASGSRTFTTQIESTAPTTGTVILQHPSGPRIAVGSVSGLTLLAAGGNLEALWPVGPVPQEIAAADLDGLPGEEVLFVTATGSLHARTVAGADLPGWPLALDASSSWSSPVVVGDFSATRRVASIERTPAGIARAWMWEADGSIRPGFPVTFARSTGATLDVPGGCIAARAALGGPVYLWASAWHTDSAGRIELRLYRFGLDGTQVVVFAEPTSARQLQDSFFFVGRRALGELRSVELGSEPGAEILVTGVLGWSESYLGVQRRYGTAHPLFVADASGLDPRRRAQTRAGHLSNPALLALPPTVADLDRDGFADLIVARENKLYIESAQVRADATRTWGLDRADARRTGCHGCEPDPVVAVPPDPRGPLRLIAAPNPFNPHTTLVLRVGEGGRVVWQVLDVRGRRVRQWSSWARDGEELREPFAAVDDDGSALASGVYFVEAIVGGRGVTTRINLVR